MLITEQSGKNGEPKDEIPQNNYSEAQASVVMGPNVLPKASSFDPSKQYDSEGMCIEE